MASKDEWEEKYQCCFCGLTIDHVLPDVGGLLYTMGINRPDDSRPGQQLYCHTNCLLARLHPSVDLYVIDVAN
jgi:hypothetical protein